ncbi:uncharacterized protein EV422DRAFT_581091 [Fimicolochytrium jonesii]|uniref:uncharacterized protein n=1 Tax=Fimicolochytrium jonesii TaxID=1396493 RepID=UPI0022FF42A8|nr:uncharacterized protein EV422DRAFT_581091 [Fimicolochytrium jonesii]KAI8816960.1 hypothetical protein EV422DRAFT_581091 [Fimicolochytrium jonesii]
MASKDDVVLNATHHHPSPSLHKVTPSGVQATLKTPRLPLIASGRELANSASAPVSGNGRELATRLRLGRQLDFGSRLSPAVVSSPLDFDSAGNSTSAPVSFASGRELDNSAYGSRLPAAVRFGVHRIKVPIGSRFSATVVSSPIPPTAPAYRQRSQRFGVHPIKIGSFRLRSSPIPPTVVANSAYGRRQFHLRSSPIPPTVVANSAYGRQFRLRSSPIPPTVVANSAYARLSPSETGELHRTLIPPAGICRQRLRPCGCHFTSPIPPTVVATSAYGRQFRLRSANFAYGRRHFRLQSPIPPTVRQFRLRSSPLPPTVANSAYGRRHFRLRSPIPPTAAASAVRVSLHFANFAYGPPIPPIVAIPPTVAFRLRRQENYIDP